MNLGSEEKECKFYQFTHAHNVKASVGFPFWVPKKTANLLHLDNRNHDRDKKNSGKWHCYFFGK